MSEQRNPTDYSQFIAENFGANATYVEGLLSRFRSDPSLVGDEWRAYFTEMLGGQAGDGDGGATMTATATAQSDGNGASNATRTSSPAEEAARISPPDPRAETSAQPAPQAASAPPQQAAQAQPASTVAAPANTDASPIRGGALKIVENMETSLTVPTATSNRQVPVKILEENRAIINAYL
ncbi:MAG TPA: hypothetical protein VM934_13550, partial [Pyrinomonadaceae bacterium]|nr:hypothetical protein [Pyrinomonadaceae bacterium]